MLLRIARATQILILIFKKFFNHTSSVISIHDQCLYTTFEHSFHQCKITEIKQQATFFSQFGLFNSASRGLHPQDSLLYNSQFLSPAITKHFIMPLHGAHNLLVNNITHVEQTIMFSYIEHTA